MPMVVSVGDGFVEAILEAGRTLFFFDGFIFEFVLILFGGGGSWVGGSVALVVFADVPVAN